MHNQVSIPVLKAALTQNLRSEHSNPQNKKRSTRHAIDARFKPITMMPGCKCPYTEPTPDQNEKGKQQ